MSFAIKVKKSWGQHFLQDTSFAARILDLLREMPSQQVILEVGAGTGNLTDFLLKNATGQLYLMDIDSRCIAYLKKRYTTFQQNIIEANFLTFPLQERFQGKTLTIVGNFPYNISTEILFKILEHRHMVNQVIGMFQKEVAERCAAQPGSKRYGIPSVLLQAFYKIKYCFTVPPTAFYPQPSVYSAVLTMERNTLDQLPCDEAKFFQVVKRSFRQRRKKLHNALAEFDLTNVPTAIGHKRAEALSVEEFIALTHAIQEKE